VNRLLPAGWRFSLDSQFAMQATNVASWNIVARGSTIAYRGEGRLEQWDQFGTVERQSHAWQRRFRESLQQLIESGSCEFLLSDTHDHQVLVDSYQNCILDLPDLEAMPAMTAAAALVHALEEGQARTNRTAHPSIEDFEHDHAAAISGMERDVMGRSRYEEGVLTVPAGVDRTSVPPSREFQMWIPYVRNPAAVEEGDVVAVILYMRGNSILRSRSAGFRNLAEFRSSAASWTPGVATH
ncbi:MAG: hypothetical protein NXI32_30765, partial [bacterium]|nr:hypothetical protein [bacterium]